MMKRNKFSPIIVRRVPGNHQFPIALSDMMILMVLAIWAMFEIAVANIAPKTPSEHPSPHVPPGVVQVMMTWPDVGTPGGCADIDLWMQSPDDVGPVGFLYPKDVMTNLLRDDIGCINNPLGKNFEIMQTHGVPAGEYIVNLHYYYPHGESIPIKIHIVGDVIKGEGDARNDLTIFDQWVTLKFKNDLATVVVFDLDKDGKVTGMYHYPRIIVPTIARNQSGAQEPGGTHFGGE